MGLFFNLGTKREMRQAIRDLESHLKDALRERDEVQRLLKLVESDLDKSEAEKSELKQQIDAQDERRKELEQQIEVRDLCLNDRAKELSRLADERDKWKAVALKYPPTNNQLLATKKESDARLAAIGGAVEILIACLPKASHDPQDQSDFSRIQPGMTVSGEQMTRVEPGVTVPCEAEPKFKVGDRVRLEPRPSYLSGEPIAEKRMKLRGRVVGLNDALTRPIKVRWDDTPDRPWCYAESELTLLFDD